MAEEVGAASSAAAFELDGEAGVTTIVSWTAIKRVDAAGGCSSLEVVAVVRGVTGGVASDRETVGRVADLGRSWDLARAA